MWNLAAPPGFQGLRDDLPLEVYFRHLPHWRQEGATYFATFRLADSLPQVKLDELAELRQEWQQRHSPPYSREALENLARESMIRIENWLDQGMGCCALKDPASAGLIKDAMHHFDGDRYELIAYVVMANHVHVLVRPTKCADHPLESIIGSWKQYSAKRILPRIGMSKVLWQDESHDRIVRDEEHLYRCLQYIGRNPRKAGQANAACPLWIRPAWIALGWKFEIEDSVC